MSNHVVLGAGPVGRAIVQSLVSRQIDVTVVSRSGTGVPGARSIAASVLDTDRLKEIVAGADAVYQASQPEYHRWPEEFPAMQDSIVRAVRDSGAVLVAVENLYGYGPVKGPMSESLPLVATGRKGKVRSDMWRALETESKAGRLKVTVGRASDFFGPYAEGSAVGDRFFLPLIAGKKAEVMGNPDALHSYTYVKDFGEALVRLALDERSLGRAWHVPNAPAVSNRKFLETAAAIAGGSLLTVLIASLKNAVVSKAAVTGNDNQGLVEVLGKELFSTYILPFEISSVLFIAAIVGAVVLAKREKQIID
jgi:nucleoside-diphosphate-sugar epimerase